MLDVSFQAPLWDIPLSCCLSPKLFKGYLEGPGYKTKRLVPETIDLNCALRERARKLWGLKMMICTKECVGEMSHP